MSARSWDEVIADLEEVESHWLVADAIFDPTQLEPETALDIAARFETIRRQMRWMKEVVAEHADA